MFQDSRSKKVILVAHCILNQNAKIDRCAHYPGAIREVTEAIIAAGVGMIQMPCPELLHLGLDRQVMRGVPTTVEAEDTRVARRMAEEPGKTLCRAIASDLVYQVEQYRRNGFEVVGILGINGSPTCGVETTWQNHQEMPGAGVFIQALCEGLAGKNIPLRMRGIKAYEPGRAVAAVMELLNTTASGEG